MNFYQLGAFMALLWGLALGSFVNVVWYRVPLKKSIVLPPSSCPACGQFIKWYHNIPVLSYLLLRGKCAYCKAPISPLYLGVEGLFGLTSLICWLFSANHLAYYIVLYSAVALTIIASGLVVRWKQRN